MRACCHFQGAEWLGIVSWRVCPLARTPDSALHTLRLRPQQCINERAPHLGVRPGGYTSSSGKKRLRSSGQRGALARTSCERSLEVIAAVIAPTSVGHAHRRRRPTPWTQLSRRSRAFTRLHGRVSSPLVLRAQDHAWNVDALTIELEGVIPGVVAGDASRPHHEARTLATRSDKERELTLLKPADGTEIRVVADVAPHCSHGVANAVFSFRAVHDQVIKVDRPMISDLDPCPPIILARVALQLSLEPRLTSSTVRALRHPCLCLCGGRRSTRVDECRNRDGQSQHRDKEGRIQSSR